MAAIDPRTLAASELFAGTGDEVLAELAERAEVKLALADSVLFRQDEAATHCRVLLDGQVKISQIGPEGHQVIVRFIPPGQMFGCVPSFIEAPYPATATAVVDCVVAGWHNAVLRELMERHPRLAMNALAVLGQRLQAAQAHNRQLATERVERRIARALLALVRQAGRKVEDGVLIDFPASRQDIGEMAGATLHTVSRTLSGWEQSGIIAGRRRRIIIRNPHALVAIAEEF